MKVKQLGLTNSSLKTPLSLKLLKKKEEVWCDVILQPFFVTYVLIHHLCLVLSQIGEAWNGLSSSD